MKNRVKNKLKRAIIQHMCEISFKSFLECNDDIYEIYETFGFEDNDFYDILEEIKNEALEHFDSDESCDDIIVISETYKCVDEEIKEDDKKCYYKYIIRKLYLKIKEETLSPIKRFDYLYKLDNEIQVGYIDIFLSEGDEFNINKMIDIKNKYAENFMYFLEHDILITDN